MKKLFFTLALMFAIFTANAQTYTYDVNGDGFINITDVACLVNKILGVPNSGEEPQEPPQVPQAYITCPDDYHPHLIDLGLPSGTKWACCNVDTDHPENQSPTNYGGYYAWGETETKSIYSWSTYIHYDESSRAYNNLGSDIAGTQYDVAHVKWGDSWVMPSKEQQNELKNNCTYEWTTVNGVNGGKFTSKTNGGSIFLPAAGARSGSDLIAAGSYGNLWTSSKDSSSSGAYILDFNSRGTTIGYAIISWIHGLSVRPVSRN